ENIHAKNFAASGNAGMLDIVAALEWIRDNIAEFGGDANNVTLFGNSGGGCKVSVLMAMPAAQGLFHKAIVQSGTLRNLSGPRLQRTRIAQALLEYLSLPAERFAELQHVPLARLYSAIAAMENKFGDPFSMGIFTPTLDGHFLSERPFDPQAPAISKNIPLLIGSTRDEMRVLLGEAAFAITIDQLLPTLQQLTGVDASTAALWIDLYRETDRHAAPSDILFALASDFFIRCDAIVQAQRKSLQPAPVYMYQFIWQAPAFGGKYRAAHGLEVPFVFANVDKAPGLCAAPAQYRALEANISAAWLAFARTGRPGHDALPAWPQYQIDTRKTMLLGDACEVVNDPAGELRQAMCTAKFQ
ncbi:MAG TPA: carboxylesterase family protein, partial [Spongiibacteraceae bacterium]|nr:carboxylesterase family protein [Spongiibacteraceae bacterium]